jgi:hypothetical protein
MAEDFNNNSLVSTLLPDHSLFKLLAEKFSLVRLNGKDPQTAEGKGWTDYCNKKRDYSEIPFKPHENAGIAGGHASGVIAVDVDNPELFESFCNRHGWNMPPTRTHGSRKGFHALYEYPKNGKVYGCKAKPVLGLDIKGSGGQVVAPGSIHPESGKPYTIISDMEPAELPACILGLYEKDRPEWSKVNIEKLRIPKTVKQYIREHIELGERSEAMWAVLTSLAKVGLSDDQIYYVFYTFEIGQKFKAISGNRDQWLKKQIDKARIQAKPQPDTFRKDPHAPESFLPRIDAKIQDLRLISSLAWNAIKKANEPPRFFRHPTGIVRLENKEGIVVPRVLGENHLRHHLARAADFYTKKHEGEHPALPPMHLVKDMLADPEPPLPYLARIVEHPIFSPDGTLHLEPGYMPETQCYLVHTTSLKIPKISNNPSASEIESAKNLIFEMIGDFPFVGNSERSHAVALCIQPFVRDLIPGPTPLYDIEAPAPGTGKTLLAQTLAIPALGRLLPTITEGRDEDEYRKRLTSALRDSREFICIDNIKRKFDSSAVSSAITSHFWEDRLMGASVIIRLPVRCCWIATGNNPVFSSEMARRTVRMRLDAKIDRPFMREARSFKHPKIISWATQNRHRLIWAALTIIQKWIAEGRPQPEHPKTLGMFEDWVRVIGGILYASEIAGFLGNMENFYEVSDMEGSILGALVASWWDSFKDNEVGVSDLFGLIVTKEIPLDLGDGSERSQKTRLGKQLSQLRDRQIGKYRIVTGRVEQRAQQWKLTPAYLSPVDGKRHSEHCSNVHSTFTPRRVAWEAALANIGEHSEHFPGVAQEEIKSAESVEAVADMGAKRSPRSPYECNEPHKTEQSQYVEHGEHQGEHCGGCYPVVTCAECANFEPNQANPSFQGRCSGYSPDGERLKFPHLKHDCPEFRERV